MKPVPAIRFPVICPVCLMERIASAELASIAEAILGNAPIVLKSTCHETSWTAGEIEREQIRQYLATGAWSGESRA